MKALAGSMLNKIKPGGNSDKKSMKEIECERAAEAQEKEDALLEILLPWHFEQKVAVALSFFKVPLILLVLVLGTAAHYEMLAITPEHQRYWRPTLEKGPSCVLLHIDKRALKGSYSHNFTDFILEYTNINKDWLREYKFRPFESVVGNLSEYRPWGEADQCGIHPAVEHEKQWEKAKKHKNQQKMNHICNITLNDHINAQKPDLYQDGSWFNYVKWAIPYPVIWAFYRLMFLGVHPLDRFLRRQIRQPQPVWKLITEPYFQICTFPMKILVAIFVFIRYKMLPNVMLSPYSTLKVHPDCNELVYYAEDHWSTPSCFILLIVELIGTLGMYLVGFTVLNSKLVGTWLYRFWKLVWILSAPWFVAAFMWQALTTFDYNILAGFAVMLELSFDFDGTFDISIDILQFLIMAVNIMDFVQLLVFILGLIIPRVFPHLSDYQKPERTDYQKLERAAAGP